MGTRGISIFKDDDGKEIAVLYRQMDAYPSVHGKDLYDYLKNAVLTNGIGRDRKAFNGMSDLAVRTIVHLKKQRIIESRKTNEALKKINLGREVSDDEAGQYYLYPAGTRDVGEEYVYELFVKEDKLCLKVSNCYKNGNVLYEGLMNKFDPEQCGKEDYEA